MSSDDVALRVSGLSKSYTIRHQGEHHITLAEQALSRLRHPFRRAEQETFWALKDIELEVKKGEVLGIIGRNGAGKSTLLKVLSRITAPTTGRVELYGRLGSLLEVGTGFHPELTGRENVYLNGTILGMKRSEIDLRFDEIVDFAGVEKFLDTPVKRYSSGMYVRLAFAVAAHLDTEILVIDEVLAVGDAEFQRRSVTAMGEAASQGRSVLVVSHNLSTVGALADRCAVLANGGVAHIGDVRSAIDCYSRMGHSSQLVDGWEGITDAVRWNPRGLDRTVEIRRVRVSDVWDPNADFELDVELLSQGGFTGFRVHVTIERIDGRPVGSGFTPENLTITAGEPTIYRITLAEPRLAAGVYCLWVSTGTGNPFGQVGHFDVAERIGQFSVPPEVNDLGTAATGWAPTWGDVRFRPLHARSISPAVELAEAT